MHLGKILGAPIARLKRQGLYLVTLLVILCILSGCSLFFLAMLHGEASGRDTDSLGVTEGSEGPT